jgi:hypothetical protein
MSSDGAEFGGRDGEGRSRRWRLRFGDVVEVPGSVLHTQTVTADDGVTYHRRSVGRQASPGHRQALDHEVRALSRLGHAFPDSTGRPFPRLVGHDMDTESPWALVTPYRGAPARQRVGDLLSTRRNQLVAELFHALAHLQEADLVLGDLTLSSLFLSGVSVQLVRFESAAVVDERRADGHGWARAGDDMTAAARVLYEVFTGVPAGPETLRLQEVPLLTATLGDLFGGTRAQPPTAAAVLTRLGRSDIPKADYQLDLAAGHAEFERLRADKPQPPPAADTPTPAPEPAPRRPWRVGRRQR